MALFGSARDASLVRSVNRELINNFVDMEVAFYKLVLEDSRANIYDESDNKVYYSPMRIPCLIEKGEKNYVGDDAGYDSTRTGEFNFLREDLKDKNLAKAKVFHGGKITIKKEMFLKRNIRKKFTRYFLMICTTSNTRWN